MSQNASDAVAQEFRREFNRLFVQRLQTSLWVILLATLLFAAVNLYFNRSEPVAVQLVRMLQAAITATAIFSLGWRGGHAYPSVVAFCTVTAITLTTVLAAVLVQIQAETATLLGFMVIVLGSATLFPWGVRCQIATAALATAGIFVSLRARPEPAWPETATVLMVLLAASLSVYFSHEIRRNFETIARHNVARTRDDLALREAAARARAVVNTAADPILTFDVDGMVTSFNPAAEPVFGLAAEDAIGMRIEDLVPGLYPNHSSPEHGGGSERQVRGTRRELTAFRADGASFPVDVTVSELRLGAGRMFTAIVRDVTERKRVEALLAARAQEKARALEAQTLFLAASSHDVRSSLSIIVGLAEMLGDQARDPAGVEMANRIKHLAHTLADIMTELLQYATINQSDKVSPTPACARSLLQEVTGHFEQPCREKGLELRVHLPEPGELHTDTNKLRRIVQNLLSNAVRYTPRGHVEVRGELEPSSLRVTVSDTGIGMLPEDLDRVFIPFLRLPAARAIEPLGTGLGLATVKTFCEQLGGGVRIASAPGAGSTFVVEVPRRLP